MGEPEVIESNHLHRSALFQPFLHTRPLWIPAFAGMTATCGCRIAETGAESAGGSRAAPTKPQQRHAFPRICRTPLESGVPLSCARRGKTISSAWIGIGLTGEEAFSWNRVFGRSEDGERIAPGARGHPSTPANRYAASPLPEAAYQDEAERAPSIPG